MVHKDARYLAAAVQGLIGWEWLISGANKALAGDFPSGLAGTLDDGIKGNPNGWYVAFLKSVVLPHSVFFGYAIRAERTLEEFYQRLQPFTVPFMALFERNWLPPRSALSRFLAALIEAPVEALRAVLASRSAQSASHARQANRKPAQSKRPLLGGSRHRCVIYPKKLAVSHIICHAARRVQGGRGSGFSNDVA